MKKNIFFNKKRKKLNLLLCLALPLALVGCNTIEGAGTDIKQGGKAIERAAENNKECPKPCPTCGRNGLCRNTQN